MQQLGNDYSLTFPPLSIARYSFIQLSQLRRREVKENAQTSQRYQRGFEPGLCLQGDYERMKISLSTSGWNRVDQCRSKTSKRVLLSTAYLMLGGPDHTRLNHTVK